jgi:hypothetical protein
VASREKPLKARIQVLNETNREAEQRSLLPVESNIGLGGDGPQSVRRKFILTENAHKSPRVWAADTANSSQNQLMSEKRLRIAFGRPTFHTPQSRQPEKRFGVEPLLGALAPEMCDEEIDFSL